jgi:hypothetical protein
MVDDGDANVFGCLCRMYNSLLGESGRGESVGGSSDNNNDDDNNNDNK